MLGGLGQAHRVRNGRRRPVLAVAGQFQEWCRIVAVPHVIVFVDVEALRLFGERALQAGGEQGFKFVAKAAEALGITGE